MKKGDQVEFHITGVIQLFRGTVENPEGYHRRPEIRVTHIRREGIWLDVDPWPILKDGDYIIRGGTHGG